MNTENYVSAQIELFKQDDSLTVSQRLWKTARLCDGWAYVYGGWFDLCTPSERRKRLKYSPSHTTIKTKCKGFDSGNCKGCQWYPDEERTRCGDCRGFTDWLEKQFGFDLYGDMVLTQWNCADNWCAKGKVSDGIPRDVFVHLFVYKDGKWTHTGVSYNGEVMEASSGVQYSSRVASKWTHWAVSKLCEEDYRRSINAEPPVKEDNEVQQYPTLRNGDKGDAVKFVQQRLLELGYSLPKYGADGDFGNETLKAVKQFQTDWGLKADGVVGKDTYERLLTAPERKQYTVTITHLSKEKADEIVNKYGGKVVEE